MCVPANRVYDRPRGHNPFGFCDTNWTLLKPVMAGADDSAVYFERLQRLEAEMGEILKQGQQKRKV